MNRENWPLVKNELVEFEKWPVEVQDFGKIIDHGKEIYETYLKSLRKKNEKS